MNSIDIAKSTKDEHRDLLNKIYEGLELSESLPSQVVFTTVQHFEMDFLRMFNEQQKTFSNVVTLVLKGNYSDSFVLLRTLFENYFIFLLILNGTTFRNASGNVHSTARGAPTFYYMAFTEYDPEQGFTPNSVVIRDYDPNLAKQSKKYHKDLYNEFLKFVKVREALRLNNLVTQEENERIQVHYNFLSNFTHLTYEGIHRIFGPTEPPGRIDVLDEIYVYNHYLSELSLLYTLRINRLFLKSLTECFKSKYTVRDLANYEAFCKQVETRYEYFWFIFNDPSDYDKLEYEARQKEQLNRGKPP